jgi:hypothetical protein
MIKTLLNRSKISWVCALNSTKQAEKATPRFWGRTYEALRRKMGVGR